MKLNAQQKKKLTGKIKHITGECCCSSNSKSCLYWKYVDKGDENWQAKLIIKEIEKL